MILTQQHSASPTLTVSGGASVYGLTAEQIALGLTLTPSVLLGIPLRILAVDTARPIGYAAYAGRIDRYDYAANPPAITSAAVADALASWPDRETLSYA